MSNRTNTRLYLGIKTTAAAVALGLCTEEELGLPAPADEPQFDPVAVEIGKILSDPSTSPAAWRL